MVALTSGWFLFLCSLFLRGASTLRVQDTCEEVGLPGGQLLYVYKHPNATTRTYVHQGECSTDSILGPGKWVGLGGNGLNWRVLMSDMGNVETEAIVLEGNCTDLRCVASSKDSDQGNNQVVWEAKDGISYYIFTSATSEMEQDSFKFRASLEPADALSLCRYSVFLEETRGSEFGVQCNCDESSLTISCDDTCDTCLGSSCGKYSSVIVFDPDVDEPIVSDQSCFDIDGGQAFCYIYSANTCEISVDGVFCSSCELCGTEQVQVCADCTNIQPGAVINEAEGTGLVGIFSEPLVKELFNNYGNAYTLKVGGSCTRTSAPTYGPTKEPPTSAAPSAATLIPAWTTATWIAVAVVVYF